MPFETRDSLVSLMLMMIVLCCTSLADMDQNISDKHLFVKRLEWHNNDRECNSWEAGSIVRYLGAPAKGS